MCEQQFVMTERQAMLDNVMSVQPALAQAALRASGLRLGNRIPGCMVLRDGGLDLKYTFGLMSDLQRFSEELIASAGRGARSLKELTDELRRQLAMGTRIYRSIHGGEGECRCVTCRIRWMWLERICEAASEW